MHRKGIEHAKCGQNTPESHLRRANLWPPPCAPRAASSKLSFPIGSKKVFRVQRHYHDNQPWQARSKNMQLCLTNSCLLVNKYWGAATHQVVAASHQVAAQARPQNKLAGPVRHPMTSSTFARFFGLTVVFDTPGSSFRLR